MLLLSSAAGSICVLKVVVYIFIFSVAHIDTAFTNITFRKQHINTVQHLKGSFSYVVKQVDARLHYT